MNGHLRKRSPTHWSLCYPPTVPRVMGTAVQPRHGPRHRKASGHHHDLYWRAEGRGTVASADLGQVWHETEGYFGTRPHLVLHGLPRPQVQSMPLNPILAPPSWSPSPQRRTPQRHRERPDVLRAVPSIRRSSASAMTSSPHYTKPPARGSLPNEVRSSATAKSALKGT
jgi:hypothetical protein